MADSENDVQEIAHFTYNWTIENMYPYELLGSPEFEVPAMDKTVWQLWLLCDEDTGFLSLDIDRRFKADGPDSIEIKFEISFLGIGGQPLIKIQGKKQFAEEDSFNLRKFANQDDVFVQKREEFLPRGALTVRCKMWRIGTEISKKEMCYARTLLREFRGSCVAKVKDFSRLRGGEEREALLIASVGEDIPFTLEYIISEKDDQQYVRIDQNVTLEKLVGKIEISLLDKTGNVVNPKSTKELRFRQIFRDFVDKRKLMKNKASLLPDDVLSLRVEYELVAKVWGRIEKYLNSSELEKSTSKIDKKGLEVQNETSFVPSSITEALKILLEEGVLSDVSLRSGSKSFPAHKCILSVRSPIFKAMFSGDTKQKTSKSVVVPDLDGDTLRELLSYIYTDAVGELEWRGAADLYRAACKYALPDLKRKCATLLKSDLSVGNVCAVLGVADLHHDQELREAALEFAVMEGEKFLSSDEWRSLKEENSKLAVEIMERIFCNMKTNL